MNSLSPFLLVGITPEPFKPEQQKHVNLLFQQGLDYLYIRSRETDPVFWQQMLEQIDPGFYSRLLLPGNAPAEAAGGQCVRHIREAERLQGIQQPPAPGKLYSTSTHNLEEVPAFSDGYSLVFYSPVFDSISKAGYGPQLTWEELRKQMADLHLPGARPSVLGLGGVCAENIPQVQAAGFGGAAFLGALWQAEEPVAALAQIQARLRNSRP